MIILSNRKADIDIAIVIVVHATMQAVMFYVKIRGLARCGSQPHFLKLFLYAES
jgi:hypothetical protein